MDGAGIAGVVAGVVAGVIAVVVSGVAAGVAAGVVAGVVVGVVDIAGRLVVAGLGGKERWPRWVTSQERRLVQRYGAKS